MNPDGLEMRVGCGNEGGEICRQTGGAFSLDVSAVGKVSCGDG